VVVDPVAFSCAVVALQAKERLAASLCLQKMADTAFQELRARSNNGAKGSTVGDWMVGGTSPAWERPVLSTVTRAQ